MPRRVVIDTDPGIDDVLALSLALASPEIEVALVTTVAGNVGITTATGNAACWISMIRPDPLPGIARGAGRPLARGLRTAKIIHGDDGLGGAAREIAAHAGRVNAPVRRDAVDRLIAEARAHGPDLTLVALGPLTNLARAGERDHGAMRRIGRVIVMGGAVRAPGNATPAAEFNFLVDPEAAAMVLGAGLALTLVPLDVTQQVRLSNAELREALGWRRDRHARALRRVTAALLSRLPDAGMALHDPLAVGLAIRPDLVTTERLPITVVTGDGPAAGMSLADLRHWRSGRPEGVEVDVATRVDARAMLDLFRERVLRAPERGLRREQRESTPPPRVAVIGGANVDLVVSGARLPLPGETVVGDDLQRFPGGKGANQAVAAMRAGARVSFAGRLGRDAMGEDYLTELASQGIDVSGVSRDDRPTGVALITIDRAGQNQITVAPGANDALEPGHLGPLADALDEAGILIAQFEAPLHTLIAALRMARERGVPTLLNPAPARAIPARLARLVDILVPNETEAAQLCQQPVRTLAEARAAARSLADRGFPKVVITLGRRGLVWRAGERHGRVRPTPVRQRDATAAGDTFVGYLGCALAEGQGFTEALELASAAAALSVTRPGAQPAIPTREEVITLAAGTRG